MNVFEKWWESKDFPSLLKDEFKEAFIEGMVVAKYICDVTEIDHKKSHSNKIQECADYLKEN